MSVEQDEALLEASERQRAVAAALASVRAEGLEPSTEDLALFGEVASGRLTTDKLRERVLSRYCSRRPGVSGTAGPVEMDHALCMKRAPWPSRAVFDYGMPVSVTVSESQLTFTVDTSNVRVSS